MAQPRTLIIVDAAHMDTILTASAVPVPGMDSMNQSFLMVPDETYGTITYGADTVHYPAVILTTLENSFIPPQSQPESIDVLPPNGYAKGKAAEHIPQEGTSDEG